MSAKEQFLKEFKELLEKYSVAIEAGYDGDTHGIYNEDIMVYNLKTNETWLKTQGRTITSDDVE